MKFGNIQKFPVVLKLWLKIESFDHSGPAKDEIGQNPEIFSCVGSKPTFLTTQNMRRMNLAKCRRFEILIRVQNLAQNEIFDHSEPAKDEIGQNPEIFSCVGSKPTFLTTQNMRRMNLAKCRRFESSWKFGSKLTFLTTKDLRRIKFGKILQFSVVLKIWLRTDIFDLSEHAKDEIWQNSEIFSRGENLDQNWEFDHSGPAKNEVRLNPEILSCLEFFAQNWHSWPENQNEIWQNPENLIHVENLAQKWHFSPLKRPAKDEIWQNPDILSHHVENLAKTDIFDNLEHGKDEFWQHPEISSCTGYLTQNWEFWPLWTCKHEIWQNPEIMSCVENLAQKLDFQPLRTCVG